METIAFDDERMENEKIRRIRHLRPDTILFAGGTAGENINLVLRISELPELLHLFHSIQKPL